MKIATLTAVQFLWLAGCWTVSLALANKIDYCFTDGDCADDFYCNSILNGPNSGVAELSQHRQCFPCQDCPAVRRLEIRTCAHSHLSQCGDCLDGYQESAVSRVNYSSCELITNLQGNSSSHLSTVLLKAPDKSEVAAEKTSSMTSQIVILAGIALAALVAAAVSILLGRVYHKRLAKKSYDAVAHLEDFSPRELPEIHSSESTEPLVYCWDQNINFDEKK